MFEIMKEIQFDAAHRLTGHKGKCWNIHGHRYRVEIHLQSKELDSMGMVLDFYELKWLKEWVDDKWDHGFILNEEDIVNIEHCKKHGYKHFILNGEPTAENMSALLSGMITAHVKRIFDTLHADKEVTVARVTVYETPTCSATHVPAQPLKKVNL